MELIAAVALVAVLCVYMMSPPAEVHSFAVLRSIGITKRQLVALMGLESLLLLLPAVLFGIPLGALFTKLALRLLLCLTLCVSLFAKHGLKESTHLK